MRRVYNVCLPFSGESFFLKAKHKSEKKMLKAVSVRRHKKNEAIILSVPSQRFSFKYLDRMSGEIIKKSIMSRQS